MTSGDGDILPGYDAEELCRLSISSLDNLPYTVSVVSVPDYRLVFANRALIELMRSLGVELSEDDIGSHPWEIVDAWREVLEPVYEEVRTSGQPKRLKNLEYEVNGTVTYWDAAFVPNFDDVGQITSIVSIRVDTTDRHNAEEALRRSEENLQAIFDSAAAAFLTYDRNGNILQVNSACEELYGYSKEQMVGRRVCETIARPEDRPRVEDVISRVFAGEAVTNLEWENVRADDSSVYVLVSVTPVCNASGDVTMGLSLVVDITERKLAEQRAHELARHKKEFYRRTIEAATDGKLILADPAEIRKVAGPLIKRWKVRHTQDVSSIRDDAIEIARTRGMDEPKLYGFSLCAGEALTNAFRHANGGVASLHEVVGGLLFIVSDAGQGINYLALPEIALKRRYTTAVSLGMGYKVMLALADKVYLATSGEGTTVAIEEKLRVQDRPLEYAIFDEAATI